METYPVSVPVKKQLTMQDLLSFYRDHYEGTPYDLTKGVGAGPYGSPERFAAGHNEAKHRYGAWERSIAMYRTQYTHLAEVKPGVGIYHATRYICY